MSSAPPRTRGNVPLAVLRGLRDVLVFVPIAWTWYHVQGAIEAYSDGTAAQFAEADLPKDPTFLQAWAAGFNTTSLGTVAFVVFLIIVVIVLLTALINVQEHLVGEPGTAPITVNVPPGQAGPSGPSGPTISPEEIARLTTAIDRLTAQAPSVQRAGDGLVYMGQLLAGPEGGTGSVGALLSTLDRSATSMAKSADAIKRELVARSKDYERISGILEVAAGHQESMQRVITDVTASIEDTVRTMVGENEQLREMARDAQKALGKLDQASTELAEDLIRSRRIITDIKLWNEMPDRPRDEPERPQAEDET